MDHEWIVSQHLKCHLICFLKRCNMIFNLESIRLDYRVHHFFVDVVSLPIQTLFLALNITCLGGGMMGGKSCGQHIGI